MSEPTTKRGTGADDARTDDHDRDGGSNTSMPAPAGASSPSAIVASATVASPTFVMRDGPTESDFTENTIRELARHEVRARRRPLAVLFVFVWQLASAYVVATPVHAWANRVWGSHPDGDAVLFRAGAHELLTWLGDTGPALSIITRTTLLLLLVGVLISQFPLGVLLTSLASGRGDTGLAPRPIGMLRAGAAAFFPLAGLLVIASAVQLIIVGAGVFVAGAIGRHAATSAGEAGALAVRLAVVAVFLLLAAVVGVEADVARTAVARDAALGGESTAWGSIKTGLRTALRMGRKTRARAVLAWAWRSTIGLALLLAAAAVASLLGGRGGGALTALFVIHQSAVLGRTALRASWLAQATRISARG